MPAGRRSGGYDLLVRGAGGALHAPGLQPGGGARVVAGPSHRAGGPAGQVPHGRPGRRSVPHPPSRHDRPVADRPGGERRAHPFRLPVGSAPRTPAGWCASSSGICGSSAGCTSPRAARLPGWPCLVPTRGKGSGTPPISCASLRGRSAPLKAFLLDQRHLAGIGNIYADEILWWTALSPLRAAGSLVEEQVCCLADEIRTRLTEGVRLLGCTLSDFVDTEGRAGSFQDWLQAYGRQGLACRRCGGTMARTVIGGRGTAYCPDCQR